MEGDQMRAKMSTGRWTIVTAGLLLASVLLAGCEGPPERFNAPPQGQTDRPAALQDDYARMVDSAMLNERSMSPAHFVPGTAELNSLGARRLNRYATLLKVYGGPLYYDGIEDKEELAQGRVSQIKDYLVCSGVGPDNFSVEVEAADGRGSRPGDSDEARKGLTPTAQTVQASQQRIISNKY